MEAENQERLDSERRQLALDLFIMLAACASYTIGMDHSRSNTDSLSVHSCDSEVSLWLERFLCL